MSNLNKVQLIGRLGADPKLRATGSGTSVCELRVATNERWSGNDGQMQERTEWHRIVVWGRQAENVAKYLTKGHSVYVEGRLQTREYADRAGAKRYTTEIIAQNVQFLDRQGGQGGGPPPPDDHDAPPSFGDDGIPF